MSRALESLDVHDVRAEPSDEAATNGLSGGNGGGERCDTRDSRDTCDGQRRTTGRRDHGVASIKSNESDSVSDNGRRRQPSLAVQLG